jgi:hypothetical protein
LATVKRDLGPGPEGGREAGQPLAADVTQQAPRWRRALDRPRALIRRNWIFSIALAVSLAPRAIAMLGFQPAVLFRMDTFDYLWDAEHLTPNVINPSGYSLFLWVLKPFHSLVLVAGLQHLMGLAVAVMVYALMRRYNVPTWIATLAAAPTLFDPAQILVEQFIMADLLATTLMVTALFLLLLRDKPSLWRVATVGLLMGASATVRPTTLPLIILIPAYLLIRRIGWQRAGAALVAGVLPVVAYMGWFDAVHGSFNMTNSNGLFLWSRTMSFANCAVIKPPADLQALCPNEQPGRLGNPVAADRPLPKNYLWDRATWEWKPPSHQFVPDIAAFTKANNDRALRFALKAIAAQPLAYAGVVAQETVEPLIHTNVLRFPANNIPNSIILTPGNLRYATAAVTAYNGYTPALKGIIRHRYGTQLVQPYTAIMAEYQQIVFLPGFLLGLIVLTGLAGILIPARRTAAALLLWISAVIIMVLPTAEHEYTYRYVIPAVPLVCMAAALMFREPLVFRRPKTAAVAAAPGAAGAAEAGPAAPPSPPPPASAPTPGAPNGAAAPPAAAAPADPPPGSTAPPSS